MSINTSEMSIEDFAILTLANDVVDGEVDPETITNEELDKVIEIVEEWIKGYDYSTLDKPKGLDNIIEELKVLKENRSHQK